MGCSEVPPFLCEAACKLARANMPKAASSLCVRTGKQLCCNCKDLRLSEAFVIWSFLPCTISEIREIIRILADENQKVAENTRANSTKKRQKPTNKVQIRPKAKDVKALD